MFALHIWMRYSFSFEGIHVCILGTQVIENRLPADSILCMPSFDISWICRILSLWSCVSWSSAVPLPIALAVLGISSQSFLRIWPSHPSFLLTVSRLILRLSTYLFAPLKQCDKTMLLWSQNCRSTWGSLGC